jgi:hypothetical protein
MLDRWRRVNDSFGQYLGKGGRILIGTGYFTSQFICRYYIQSWANEMSILAFSACGSGLIVVVNYACRRLKLMGDCLD